MGDMFTIHEQAVSDQGVSLLYWEKKMYGAPKNQEIIGKKWHNVNLPAPAKMNSG